MASRLLPTRAVALLVLVGSALWSGCESEEAKREEPVRLTGEAFGTTWSVVFVPSRGGAPAPHTDELQRVIDAALERVDSLMSAFRSDSELGRFNSARGTEPFELAPEARKVVSAALDLARETGGAFDPTVAPLVGLWGFGAAASEGDPDEGEIEETLDRVGYRNLSWDDHGRLVRSVGGVELDLSGIAKGYGVDAVMVALAAYRPAGVMVEIGGDLRVMGTRAGGEPWRLGIESPLGGLDSVITMTEGALATSGDYRQRAGEGAKRRTHIVEPRTGRPAPASIASVSVIAPTALEADAVATALVVLGEDEGIRYVEARPWIEAMIMARPVGEESEVGAVHLSRGWPSE